MRTAKPARLGTLAIAALAALVTTASGSTLKPRLATGGVTAVHGGSGQLEGVVNPNGLETSYFFEYGLTTAFGSSTKPVAVGKEAKEIKVGQTITGLVVGEHYRIVATYVNPANGQTETVHGKEKTYKGKGSDRTRFEIEKGKEAELTAVYEQTFEFFGSLTGKGNADVPVSLQGTAYPYTGAFRPLAGPITTSSTGRFVFKVPHLTSNTELRVLTDGTRPVYSPPVTVHVVPLIVLHVRSGGKSGLYRLYGTVAPARNGVPIVIQELLPQKVGSKRSGPRPHEVARTVLKRATSTLSRFSVIVSLSGTYHYQAFVQLPKGALNSGASNHVEIRAPKSSVKHKHKK
jgi:hypothetical protein